jgi:hypothetical protein
MEKGGKTGKIKSKHAKSFVSDEPSSQTSYGDGAPFDRVQYLEAKLILKPDRFTSVKSFRDFGKIVRRSATQLAVGFIEDKNASLRPEIREIIFFDTPDFSLYSNAFILRRRVSYVDGFPVGDYGAPAASTCRWWGSSPFRSSSTAKRISRRSRKSWWLSSISRCSARSLDGWRLA